MRQTEQQGRQNSSWVRDHLANERTYLAWMRSAIALMGFGILIVHLRYEYFCSVLPLPSWELELSTGLTQ